MAKLQPHVTIVSVYHAWPGQLAAYVRLPDAPPNLLIDLHLDAGEKDVVEQFLQRAPRYVDTARAFVLAHPATTFELWYRDGESVGTDSLELHGISDPDDRNLRRVKAARSEAVLLRDHGESRKSREWVVLPTGEVVDWKE